MKIAETEIVTYKRKKVIAVKCDKCGDDIPKESRYSTRDFEIEFTRGSAYPDGGHKIGWQVEDLCDNCVDYLKTVLEENGFPTSKVDIDW